MPISRTSSATYWRVSSRDCRALSFPARQMRRRDGDAVDRSPWLGQPVRNWLLRSSEGSHSNLRLQPIPGNASLSAGRDDWAHGPQHGGATERLLSQPFGLGAGKSAGSSGVVSSDIPTQAPNSRHGSLSMATSAKGVPPEATVARRFACSEQSSCEDKLPPLR